MEETSLEDISKLILIQLCVDASSFRSKAPLNVLDHSHSSLSLVGSHT